MFECGFSLESVRKIFFIGCQGWANQMVEPGKAISLHFFPGFRRAPALFHHAVRGNHHARAVITGAAVDEDFFAGILAKQREEAGENFVPRMNTKPVQINILHAETVYLFSFSVA